MVPKLTILFFVHFNLFLVNCLPPDNVPKEDKLGRMEKFTNKMKSKFFLDCYGLAKLARDMYGREHFQEARDYLSKAINANDSVGEFYYERARCHIKLDNIDDAIKDLRDAIKKTDYIPNKRNYEIFLCRTLIDFNLEEAEKEIVLLHHVDLVDMARQLEKESKLKEAIILYEQAIAKHPLEKYYRLLGLCHKRAGNLDSAIEAFQEAVVAPKKLADGETRELLIATLIDSNRLDDAINEMQKWSSSELLAGANSLLRQDKYRNAVHLFTELITKKPQESLYYQQRGRCNAKIGEWESAVSDFREALKRGAKEYVRHELIQALLDLDNKHDAVKEMNLFSVDQLVERADELSSKYHPKFEDAISYYTTAINRDSSNAKLYRSRADCYMKKESFKEALSDFEQMLDYENNHQLTKLEIKERAEVILALELYKIERIDEVKKVTQNFNGFQLLELAKGIMDTRWYNDAQDYFKRALSLNPQNSMCYQIRAKYYRNFLRSDDAMADYKKAAEINPLCAECWISIAELYLEDKKYITAKRTIQNQQQLLLVDTTPEDKKRIEKVLRIANRWIQEEMEWKAELNRREAQAYSRKREYETQQREDWEKAFSVVTIGVPVTFDGKI